MINVYLDLSQSALKYLKDTEVNINNILIMTGNFRNNFWDPNFLYYSTYRDTLFEIADSFQLEISKPTEFFPTRYSNNNQDSNSVLDLVFLHSFSSKFDNHHIYPDWRLTSDDAPILVNIFIFNECISIEKQSFIKNSNKENYFLEKLVNFIKSMNTSSIHNIEALEIIVQILAINIENI